MQIMFSMKMRIMQAKSKLNPIRFLLGNVFVKFKLILIQSFKAKVVLFQMNRNIKLIT